MNKKFRLNLRNQVDKVGIILLVLTTYMNSTTGFPVNASYHEGTVEGKRLRAISSVLKNLGILILIAPFYLLMQTDSTILFDLGRTGIIVTVSAFFYNILPLNIEGKYLFKWSKSISISLIFFGTLLFIGSRIMI
jgi:hypothetical protein